MTRWFVVILSEAKDLLHYIYQQAVGAAKPSPSGEGGAARSAVTDEVAARQEQRIVSLLGGRRIGAPTGAVCQWIYPETNH